MRSEIIQQQTENHFKKWISVLLKLQKHLRKGNSVLLKLQSEEIEGLDTYEHLTSICFATQFNPMAKTDLYHMLIRNKRGFFIMSFKVNPLSLQSSSNHKNVFSIEFYPLCIMVWRVLSASEITFLNKP